MCAHKTSTSGLAHTLWASMLWLTWTMGLRRTSTGHLLMFGWGAPMGSKHRHTRTGVIFPVASIRAHLKSQTRHCRAGTLASYCLHSYAPGVHALTHLRTIVCGLGLLWSILNVLTLILSCIDVDLMRFTPNVEALFLLMHPWIWLVCESSTLLLLDAPFCVVACVTSTFHFVDTICWPDISDAIWWTDFFNTSCWHDSTSSTDTSVYSSTLLTTILKWMWGLYLGNNLWSCLFSTKRSLNRSTTFSDQPVRFLVSLTDSMWWQLGSQCSKIPHSWGPHSLRARNLLQRSSPQSRGLLHCSWCLYQIECMSCICRFQHLHRSPNCCPVCVEGDFRCSCNPENCSILFVGSIKLHHTLECYSWVLLRNSRGFHQVLLQIGVLLDSPS